MRYQWMLLATLLGLSVNVWAQDEAVEENAQSAVRD